jgi:nicotinamidase/pyrazinamidase
MNKILIVVDYQNDFVNPNGALPVPNADTIYQNIQNRIDSDEYDKVIYTFDTHTTEQYNGSEEQAIFPGIHCEFGTDGWNLYKIKPRNNDFFQSIVNSSKEAFTRLCNGDECFFTKDVFDIWQGNDIYPEWFTTEIEPDKYEIDVVGVAQNYCCFLNIMGMVERGYKVNLIQDCTMGIKVFPDGTIDESFENNNKTMKDAGVTFK